MLKKGKGLIRSLLNKPNIQANIDSLDSGILSGWVYNSSSPDEAQSFYLSFNGLLSPCLNASAFRDDLLSAGMGNGCHGFSVPLNIFSFDIALAKSVNLLDGSKRLITTFNLPTEESHSSLSDLSLLGQCQDYLLFSCAALTQTKRFKLNLFKRGSLFTSYELELHKGQSLFLLPLPNSECHNDTASSALACASDWAISESRSCYLAWNNASSNSVDIPLVWPLDESLVNTSERFFTDAESYKTKCRADVFNAWLASWSSTCISDKSCPQDKPVSLKQVETFLNCYLKHSYEIHLSEFFSLVATPPKKQTPLIPLTLIIDVMKGDNSDAAISHTLKSLYLSRDSFEIDVLLFGKPSDEINKWQSALASAPIKNIASIKLFEGIQALPALINADQNRHLLFAQAGIEFSISCLSDLVSSVALENKESECLSDIASVKAAIAFAKTISIQNQFSVEPEHSYSALADKLDPSLWCSNTTLLFQFIESLNYGEDFSLQSYCAFVNEQNLPILYDASAEAFVTTKKELRLLNKLSHKQSHANKKTILFIDFCLPDKQRDAASYAAFQEMRLLKSLGYHICFVSQDLAYDSRLVKVLKKSGIEVCHQPYYKSLGDLISTKKECLAALYITRFYVAEVVYKVLDKLQFVLPVLFNNADLHFLREMRLALNAGDQAALQESYEIRQRELRICQLADAVLCYNRIEHAVICSHIAQQDKLHLTPWVLDAKNQGLDFSKRQGLAFLGGFNHQPNIEALEFLISEVMPLLKQQRPDISLHVYGSQMPDEYKQRQTDNIFMHGFVDNLDDVFHQHRVFVVPLMSGAGIKGKLLESMAYGLPAVVTSIAAEGTGLSDGISALFADTPAAWCDRITRLYDDAVLWQKMADNALLIANEQYSFAHGQSEFKKILSAIDLY